MVGAYHPTRPCAYRLLGFETLKDLEFRNREGEFKQETTLALSRRSRRGSRRFCPSGMHSRRSSSPAREFERAQIDPDASEAPVSSMTYGKAALCRLLTLVVDVVVYGVVCVRIGRGDAAVAPPYSSVPGWVAAFQPACKVGSGPAPSFYKRFGENVLLIRRI